jgi:hypothetical protein
VLVERLGDAAQIGIEIRELVKLLKSAGVDAPP